MLIIKTSVKKAKKNTIWVNIPKKKTTREKNAREMEMVTKWNATTATAGKESEREKVNLSSYCSLYSVCFYVHEMCCDVLRSIFVVRRCDRYCSWVCVLVYVHLLIIRLIFIFVFPCALSPSPFAVLSFLLSSVYYYFLFLFQNGYCRLRKAQKLHRVRWESLPRSSSLSVYRTVFFLSIRYG